MSAVTLIPEQWTFDDFVSVDAPAARRTIQADGCWLWLGPLNPKGYGNIRRILVPGGASTGMWMVHRYVYTILVGPIPEGLVLDHLCRVRHCVNPSHLRACTNYDNITAPGSTANVVKTHCCRGHELTPANTRICRNGTRRCRECQRGYDRTRA